MTVYGTTDLTALQMETHAGDGHRRQWVVAFPFGMAPIAIVNGTLKAVGIKGVDTGKDFYWSAGDPVLTQDSGVMALADNDTLQIIYVGRFPVVHARDEEPPTHASVTVHSHAIISALIDELRRHSL